MSEIHSALIWERGSAGLSPLTVTLQEAEVCGRHLLMALVCEGTEGGSCPELPAGYLCESLVGWFYHVLLPECQRSPEHCYSGLEEFIRKHLERAVGEWKEYAWKKHCEEEIRLGGIVFLDRQFVAFGNLPVYVLNKRFNKARRKNLLSMGEKIAFSQGEIRSFLSFYLENDAMRVGISEEELLESLYAEEAMEERRLEKRLSELGKAAGSRVPGRSLGAVILEVIPC